MAIVHRHKFAQLPLSGLRTCTGMLRNHKYGWSYSADLSISQVLADASMLNCISHMQERV